MNAAAVNTDLEIELLTRIAAGEQGEALSGLIDRYSRPLFGLGMRLLGDRGLAEEMVQDSFVRLWRSAGSFDSERGSVKTFVYTIARRAAIDIQRRSQRAPIPVELIEEDRPLGSEAGQPDEFERLVDGIELREAMEELSTDHRDVLVLFYDEDLSQRAIAAQLGIPVGTVKTRTYHALRALRTELEGRELNV